MVTTNNLNYRGPEAPRDFLADMAAQECAIHSKVFDRTISAAEAARQLNALGGMGWWDAFDGRDDLRWTRSGGPLGPICPVCRDSGVVRRLGSACAECRMCPKGNDLAAIISHRREAMKLREGAPAAPPKTVRGENVTIRVDGVPVEHGVGILEPMELRHARANVEDLRKKLDDARRELRYQRAIAPEGTRRVEGFVSEVRERQTPNHSRFAAYLDARRVMCVADACSGPNGFVHVYVGDLAKLRTLAGIVHVFEFTGPPSALPDSLEFAP